MSLMRIYRHYDWAVAFRSFFAENFPGTFGTLTYKPFLIFPVCWRLANEDESFGEAHLQFGPFADRGDTPGRASPLTFVRKGTP